MKFLRYRRPSLKTLLGITKAKIDKIHRRGKVGWDVGKHIEVIPHYRRPHMALVWTGHGRVVLKIVPRRGSVVHREVVEKVPMGLEGG